MSRSKSLRDLIASMIAIRLILACCVVALSALGQRLGGPLYFAQKVPPATFESCRDVEAPVNEFSNDGPLWVYVVESFPSDQRSLFFPFFSDDPRDDGGFLWQALGWLNSYRDQAPPTRAILYFVNGRYAFRCRDNKGHFTESYGPRGNPLQLKIASGKADIWHFSITENGMAYVFVITDQPLDQLDGKELMAQVKDRLGARFIILYVRNDPWFLHSSPDAAPYIFAGDRFKSISEEEYLNSKTMVCYTDTGCKVLPNKR